MGGGPLTSFEVGTGNRPTVLLHGFLGSGVNLRALARRWSEREPDRRFLLPDLPGHGASPGIPADSEFAAMGRAVLETASAAGWPGPLSLVGHSLGGRVALVATRASPERVTDVVLLDISPGPRDPAGSETRRVVEVLLQAPAEVPDRRDMRVFLIERGLSPALADWLVMNLAAVPGGFRWRIDRQALATLHDRFIREDLWPVVEGRLAPVRCIRGGQSSYVPEDDAERLRRAGASVDTLPGAGHYPHVDALEPLVDLLCRPVGAR